jgi:ATP-dependent RNA helicase DDX23/PRP28
VVVTQKHFPSLKEKRLLIMSRGEYRGNYQRDDEKNKNNGERYHRTSRNNNTNNGGGGYRNNNNNNTTNNHGGNWHRNTTTKRGRSPEREAQFPHREVHEREKTTTTTSGGGSRDAATVFQDNPFNRSASSSQAQQPLSVEELLQKKREKELAETKPTFLTKKEREKLAMERLKEKRREEGGGGDGGTVATAHHHASSSSRFARATSARDVAERQYQRDKSEQSERERQEQLEQFRKQYAGVRDETEKMKKMKQKAERAKYKFQFDWSKEDDTSRDANPLYDAKHDVKLLFGRGTIAGVDARMQMEQNHKFENSVGKRRGGNTVNNNRSRSYDAAGDENARRIDKHSKALEKYDNQYDKKKETTHWSSKPLAQMNERDWRIFREDFNITFKGGKVPNPMRAWSENELLPQEILRAIEKVGYTKPSPIQMASIPIGLLKRDVIGVAETGSGKTCAFVVPMLAHIMGLPKMTDEVAADGPYALVMAPTRELAQQIEEETLKFAHFLGYRVACVVGGQSIEDQGVQLRKGVEIVVGTPGRIIDVIEKRYTVLNQCNYIVLDEADRMIDMGFEPQVTQVMEAMPSSNLKPIDMAEELDNKAIDNKQSIETSARYRTTYMFSATMPPSVERLARTYLRNPAVVTIGSAGKTSDLIKQTVIWVNRSEKERTLEQILSQHTQTQAIVFVNTKRGVDSCVTACHSMGYSCGSIHGGKGQDAREAALTGFKRGDFDILVATDVAGRGIDVKGIDLVVNYELPASIENYTHRIGRTGRAGRKGTAVSFITSEDQDIMYDLRQLLIESNNEVPPELERQKAAKVKPQRDAQGRVLEGRDARGMDSIIF